MKTAILATAVLALTGCGRHTATAPETRNAERIETELKAKLLALGWTDVRGRDAAAAFTLSVRASRGGLTYQLVPLGDSDDCMVTVYPHGADKQLHPYGHFHASGQELTWTPLPGARQLPGRAEAEAKARELVTAYRACR